MFHRNKNMNAIPKGFQEKNIPHTHTNWQFNDFISLQSLVAKLLIYYCVGWYAMCIIRICKLRFRITGQSTSTPTSPSIRQNTWRATTTFAQHTVLYTRLYICCVLCVVSVCVSMCWYYAVGIALADCENWFSDTFSKR